MTTEQHERDTYEERLLSELRAYVAQRPSSFTAVEVQRRRRLPRVAVAGAAVATVAGGVIVATGGDGASTAYAVEPQGDGSVTVEIRKLEDADGLETKLRAAGVPAEVEYLPAGQTCKEGWFTPATAEPAAGAVTSSLRQDGSGATTFTIDPGTLKPGQVLVIATSTGAAAAYTPAARADDPAPPPAGAVATSIAMAVAQGPVGPCEVVAATPGVPVGIGGEAGASAGGGSLHVNDDEPVEGAPGARVDRVEDVEP